jgi:hypothetical protein
MLKLLITGQASASSFCVIYCIKLHKTAKSVIDFRIKINAEKNLKKFEKTA